MARADLPSTDVLEQILNAALANGDTKGVDAALRLMTVQDPHRADVLYQTIQLGLALREHGTEVTS